MQARRIDWILAFFNVLVIWSIGSIILSFSSQTIGANSIVYTCTSMFSGSICLLIYSGLGSKKIAKDILFCWQTWGYGISLILSLIFCFLLFGEVTPVEGTLLQMFTVILALIIGKIIFKRNPTVFQLVGASLIALGLLIIISGFDKSKVFIILSFLMSMSIFHWLRSYMAESHKEFRRAMESSSVPLKDQLRVIGYVVFILSCMFLFVTMLFVKYQEYYNIELHSSIPNIADFMNYKAMLIGVIVGFCLTLPERFIEFNSLARLKIENYLAIGSLSPFAVLFWQYITKDFTELDLTDFTQTDFIATLIITVGGLVMIMKEKEKKMRINKMKCHNEASKFKASRGYLVRLLHCVRNDSIRGAMFGLDARIALAIFGALSVISGAALYSAIQNARATALLTDLNETGKAWEAYYLADGDENKL